MGPLFRPSASQPYLNLNQPVTEYWFDGEPAQLACLTPAQKERLDDLVGEFHDCIGDALDMTKPRPNVPYVRLPVKADFEPGSETPFKKNPKARKLVMDFVRDLERKGMVSRCTSSEALYVCNCLTLPKGPDRYRFVCTFSQLNKNMVKDPYLSLIHI